MPQEASVFKVRARGEYGLEGAVVMVWSTRMVA